MTRWCAAPAFPAIGDPPFPTLRASSSRSGSPPIPGPGTGRDHCWIASSLEPTSPPRQAPQTPSPRQAPETSSPRQAPQTPPPRVVTPPAGSPPAPPLSSSPALGRARQGWRDRHTPPGSHVRWERSLDDRMVGGVAGGIARRLHVDVTLVRIAFAVVTVFGGFGAAAYVGAWLFMPLEGHEDSIGTRVAGDRHGIALALAFLPALVLLLVIGSALHAGAVTSVAWPLFLCAAGGVLLWRNVDGEEREWLRRATAPVVRVGSRTRWGRRRFLVRVLLGTGLVLGGVAVLSLHHGHLGVDGVLAGVAMLFAGAIVLFGPWWIRLARDLMAERQARVRAEERADMAARVHDSVLQTLALIQRAVDDPHRVVQLARGQERELRAWLFDGEIPGALGAQVLTLAAGVRAIAAEVEEARGTAVDVVVVGDCPLDDGLRALLEAAREATVNAAKWSGEASVSLFAEVEPEKVSVFVRDRGKGFDLDGVAADRRGIAHSIQARMLRHEGRAVIRTTHGEGTEVELSVPRGEHR
ncbi:MAG: PspC domain-containing protein [Acidimicrobiales bacterium]